MGTPPPRPLPRREPSVARPARSGYHRAVDWWSAASATRSPGRMRPAEAGAGAIPSSSRPATSRNTSDSTSRRSATGVEGRRRRGGCHDRPAMSFTLVVRGRGDIDLGNTIEVLKAFASYGRLEPGGEFQYLHGLAASPGPLCDITVSGAGSGSWPRSVYAPLVACCAGRHVVGGVACGLDVVPCARCCTECRYAVEHQRNTVPPKSRKVRSSTPRLACRKDLQIVVYPTERLPW